MKRIVVALLLLVVGVVALGFYQGWFHFSTEQAGDKSSMTFTVDQDKIRKDKDQAMEKVQGAGESIKEKTGSTTEKVKEETSKP